MKSQHLNSSRGPSKALAGSKAEDKTVSLMGMAGDAVSLGELQAKSLVQLRFVLEEINDMRDLRLRQVQCLRQIRCTGTLW